MRHVQWDLKGLPGQFKACLREFGPPQRTLELPQRPFELPPPTLLDRLREAILPPTGLERTPQAFRRRGPGSAVEGLLGGRLQPADNGGPVGEEGVHLIVVGSWDKPQSLPTRVIFVEPKAQRCRDCPVFFCYDKGDRSGKGGEVFIGIEAMTDEERDGEPAIVRAGGGSEGIEGRKEHDAGNAIGATGSHSRGDAGAEGLAEYEHVT